MEQLVVVALPVARFVGDCVAVDFPLLYFWMELLVAVVRVVLCLAHYYVAAVGSAALFVGFPSVAEFHHFFAPGVSRLSNLLLLMEQVSVRRHWLLVLSVCI